jgi:hypothetical protein
MKSRKMTYFKYYSLFLILIVFILITGCSGTPSSLPIINSFSADPTTINEGESLTLSWNVTDATSITIIPGNMTFDSPSGSVTLFPTMSTNYTLTATNTEGSVSSSVAINVNPAPITEETITIQPGPEGKDSYVSSNDPDTNYWTLPYMNIGKIPLISMGANRANYIYVYDYFRAYLQFNLSSLPAGAVIVNAELKLYQFNNSGTEDFMISLYQVTESWVESTITWNDRPDYISSPESTITATAGATTWLSWDITGLVQGWLDENISNYGMMLKDTDESSPNVSGCYSSEFISEPTLRPKLEITYYVP